MSQRWLAIAVVMLLARPASAESPLDIRLDNAALTWQRVSESRGAGYLNAAADDAVGIVVIPQLLKAGFAVAGSYGRGILIRRNAAGVLQPPVFLTASGGSIGWQAGVQALDIVLVFRTPEALDALMRRGLTLGPDAGVAAGPYGRGAGAASDFASDAAVLSYAVSEGFFAGVSLEGLLIRIEQRNTRAFYRDAGYAPPAAPTIDPARLPASATRLLALFNASDGVATPLPTDTDSADMPADGGLVTFGIGEAPVGADTD